MLSFIPIDKMKDLRERAKNGDEKAVKIITMQMEGEDFEPCYNELYGCENHNLDQDNTTLKTVTENNEAIPSEIEQAATSSENKDFTSDVMLNIYNLATQIDNLSMNIIKQEDINDSTRSGVLEKLSEIKKNLISAVSTIRTIKKDINKKKTLPNVENIVK